MKVNYKTHPILEKLDNGSLGYMPIGEVDQSFFMNPHGRELFIKNWKLFKDGFKKETNILSQPFMQAADKAKVKLSELLANIMGEDLSDFIVQGTYILDEWVYMIDYQTFQGSEDQEKCFYIFTKEGMPLAMNVMSEKHNILEVIWISSVFGIKGSDKEQIQNWITRKFLEVLIYAMFKKYAQVETKILLPKQKIMGSIVCKYKNDTNLSLTFLDSKWFTNLVKSDAFKVRGHFRLQPKKVGGNGQKI